MKKRTTNIKRKLIYIELVLISILLFLYVTKKLTLLMLVIISILYFICFVMWFLSNNHNKK
jgi:hypothetical protein